MSSSIETTRHTTRNGRDFDIRQALREDAGQIIKYLSELFDEPALPLMYEPGEFAMSEEQEGDFIERHQAEDALLLIAESENEIIGLINFRCDRRKRGRHSGLFGVSVARSWRGVGVGSSLIGRLLGWAQSHPFVERIGLEVFATNTSAIELYHRLGFKEEGRKREAIKLRDEYVDSVVMGLVYPPKRATAKKQKSPRPVQRTDRGP